MREINVNLITDVVEKLCIEANVHLPSDVKCAIKNCRACEDGKIAQGVLDNIIENFEIACTGGSENIKFLSGGNIQKVIVAREFSGGANFIIANQPTRGIDVGTADLIRRRLVKTTREDNNAVLLISSDLAEVMEVSDRLLVMKDGEIVAQFNDVKSVTDETLGEYMLGVKRMTPEEMGDLF